MFYAIALSGLIEPARKQLDVVCICMMMELSAFGGGCCVTCCWTADPMRCVLLPVAES